MTRRRYLRPPWWLRAIGNRLAPASNPALVARLSVRGRSSGRWRTTPVVVLAHDGERYLISPFGDTDWSRNLRATLTGRLSRRGHSEPFTAVEVPPERRAPLLDAYRRRFDRMPKVADSFRRLPDPADHPTFRIEPAGADRP
jgi:deazaflavin-dependent oxidoreductase (nitroreductase family)